MGVKFVVQAFLPVWFVCQISAGAQAVWIDTDPSVAIGGHEVDDGFALIQAFHSKEIAIRGVSVVFGNAPLHAAVPIAKTLLGMLAPGMTAYAGAAGASQLGEPTAASRALTAALRNEKLTILAIGPLTNVATVLRVHPELAPQIVRIVAVAGRRPNQHFIVGPAGTRSLRDFNFEMDPDAFQVILDSKVSLVLAPWEISSKVWLTASDLSKLTGRSAALDWLYEPASDWLALWHKNFGADGFNPFDTLAIAAAVTPTLISCEMLPVRIESSPDDTAPGEFKPYLLVSKSFDSKYSAQYCYEAKPEFKADLMRRLLGVQVNN
jgi:inosine-uridine nucleoside N-ribohydrolase